MASMTEEQMLALWKSVLHLEDVRRDCSVERDDGIDVDSLLLTRIRQWYHHLLATAPLSWVPIDEVKAEATATADAAGVVTMQLPLRAVRPIEVRLGGWECAVADFHEPASRVSKLQQSSLTRGGCASPVAVPHQWLWIAVAVCCVSTRCHQAVPRWWRRRAVWHGLPMAVTAWHKLHSTQFRSGQIACDPHPSETARSACPFHPACSRQSCMPYCR